MLKKILFTLGLVLSVSFANININDDMSKFSYPDQFDKIHSVTNDTKQLIFAFKKDSGHTVKEFLSSKENNYLKEKNTFFVADVSAMPTIIQWFALPSLKDYPYTIIVFNDDDLSAKYKNEEKIEKIMVVLLENMKVTDVKYFNDVKELEVHLEK